MDALVGKPSLCAARRWAICHLPSAICHLPSAICHLPSAISHLPSAISHLPSAISHLPSAISHLPSAICHLPSAICHLPSAISHQPSAIGHQPRRNPAGRSALCMRKSADSIEVLAVRKVTRFAHANLIQVPIGVLWPSAQVRSGHGGHSGSRALGPSRGKRQVLTGQCTFRGYGPNGKKILAAGLAYP